jgi:hypothetical protein
MHLFTDSKAALKEAVMRPSERLSPHDISKRQWPRLGGFRYGDPQGVRAGQQVGDANEKRQKGGEA